MKKTPRETNRYHNRYHKTGGTTMRPRACFTTFVTHFVPFRHSKKMGDGLTDGLTD